MTWISIVHGKENEKTKIIFKTLGLVWNDCECLVFDFQIQISRQNTFDKNEVKLVFNSILNSCTFIIKIKKKDFEKLVFSFKKYILTTIIMTPPQFPHHCGHCHHIVHVTTSITNILPQPLLPPPFHYNYYCLHRSTIIVIATAPHLCRHQSTTIMSSPSL